MTDCAIVVGVSRYPEWGDGVAPDLNGPDNDAKDVYDWLVDPGGGRLAPENVRLIRSKDFDPINPEDPQPAKAKIEKALKWLEKQTETVSGGRLYLYFSGHGFSPVVEEGALFAADATQAAPEFVYAHWWLRWFRTAQVFRETVLWMDSCMNYEQSIPVSEGSMRPQIGTGVPGPLFTALAARTKSALEHEMPDGKVHGVFTWTLLRGLRGGAADERGRVTGESLRNFLFTVMPEFLPDDARQSTAVDLRPFVRTDEGIVFAKLPARPKYPVRLVFPDHAVGEELRVWAGRPLARVKTEVLAGTEWVGELLRGLYVAEVPKAGLRHGFQVSGASTLDEMVTTQGDPVTTPDGSELFALDIVAANSAASISVMDYRFERIFDETGELHERDMPGVYKVRVEFGRDVTMSSDEVLVLDRDTTLRPDNVRGLPSPAPTHGTASTHEYQTTPFENAANRVGPFASPDSGRSVISVLARYWTDPKAAAVIPDAEEMALPHPLHGVQIIDAAGTPVVADISLGCQVDLPQGSVDPQGYPVVDPIAIHEVEVAPGNYFLRQALPDGRQYEGCVTASAGWVTQVAIQRTAQFIGTSDQRDAIGDVAVFLRRGGVRRQDTVIEGARMALADGRNLFAEGRGAKLAEELITNFTDPIAGIVGGHLLLQAMEAAVPDPVRAEQFDLLVAKLRDLVGLNHPDVEALSLRCSRPAMSTNGPFTAPPMFRNSWQLIADASYRRPELVPPKLWQRVHASVAYGAIFLWAADEKTRASHTDQLTRWISGYSNSVEAEAMPVGGGGSLVPQARTPGTRGGSRSAGSRSRSAADDAPVGADGNGPGPVALPEEVRESALRMKVPAAAAAALWAERATPQ